MYTSNSDTVFFSVKLFRSNRYARKQPYTKKYEDLHGLVWRSYISVSYTEEYGDIRRRKRPFTYRIARPGMLKFKFLETLLQSYENKLHHSEDKLIIVYHYCM